MIQVNYYTLLGQLYKSKTFKSIKSAQSASRRYDLEYGANLRKVAIDLSNNQSVLIF